LSHRSPPAPARLLDAALIEFAAAGPAGARTQRIAAAAGVNKQLIHYYFQTKDGLYRAVLEHAALAVATSLGRLPLVGLTAVERLRRLVRGQFDFFLGHPEHTAVLVQADDAGTWADHSVRPVADLLRDGQATGFFRDDVDAEAHARMALLLMLGYFAVQPITRRWGDPHAWRDRAAELIVRGASW
jgi:AcrR family transcriptional regulator